MILTCILVEIVYIFARKIGFTRSKVSFFLNIFCRLLDGTRTLCVSPGQRWSYNFFLTELTSSFFLLFFWQSFKYFLCFFSLVYLCLSEEKIFLLFPVYYLIVVVCVFFI